eukprot:s8616_g1.t1
MIMKLIMVMTMMVMMMAMVMVIVVVMVLWFRLDGIPIEMCSCVLVVEVRLETATHAAANDGELLQRIRSARPAAVRLGQRFQYGPPVAVRRVASCLASETMAVSAMCNMVHQTQRL